MRRALDAKLAINLADSQMRHICFELVSKLPKPVGSKELEFAFIYPRSKGALMAEVENVLQEKGKSLESLEWEHLEKAVLALVPESISKSMLKEAQSIYKGLCL